MRVQDNLKPHSQRARRRGRQEHGNLLRISPDGTTIASGVGQGIVLLWDVTTGQLKTTLKGDTTKGGSGGYISVAYSPDGTTIASGRDLPYNMVELWDTTTGHLKTTLISQHTKSWGNRGYLSCVLNGWSDSRCRS